MLRKQLSFIFLFIFIMDLIDTDLLTMLKDFMIPQQKLLVRIKLNYYIHLQDDVITIKSNDIMPTPIQMLS